MWIRTYSVPYIKLDTNIIAGNSPISSFISFQSIIHIAAGTIILRCNSYVIPLLKIFSGFHYLYYLFSKKCFEK